MIIGISGKARSGKDTLFAIASEYGFQKLSFAENLKARALHDFGLTVEYTDGVLKDRPTERLHGHSPREFLIELGGLYRKYDPDFWVKKGLLQAQAEPNKKWILTDVRFENEAKAIKALGGLVVRLERHWSRDAMVSDEVKASASETALDGYSNFDLVCAAEDNETPIDLAYFWNDVLALIKALEQNKKMPSHSGVI